MTVSIVIPAHNEAARITGVVERSRDQADEVLVVDDGSGDGTALVARDAGARVIRQATSRGYIAAIKAGFAAAIGEVIVTLDADGEHDPNDIPHLIAAIAADEADLVLGVRPSIARPSERFINHLTNFRVRTADAGTGFRALRADLARRLQLDGRCTCGTFVLEAAAHGARIIDIPVSLQVTDKPRAVAWGHLAQVFHVLKWLVRGK